MTIVNPEDIISDREVDRVHSHANFGDISNRDILDQGVLKAAFGWHHGYTLTMIMREHKLLNASGKLTKRGFRYLQARWDYHKLIKMEGEDHNV